MGGMYGSVFGKSSPALFHLVVLLANYLPAAVVAILFVRTSQLKSRRLPSEIPGKSLILWGLFLLVIYLVPRLFASTIQGGGPAFAVAMFGPLFIIPAEILIAVGVVKVLLAALPRLPRQVSGPAHASAA
jgi:hypothetical protein